MKKKVALSTTAIAVLASTIPTHVAPVQAEETGNIIHVNSTGAGNQNDGGDGTPTNPYKQLSTAVANAKDGDTIIITGEGYVNDLWNGGPWYIDKKLTIKSEDSTPATVSIRPAGIVLGGDVTFENVVLSMYNASSAYIYANGHKLELINTPTATNTVRTLDLYAGAKDGYQSGSYGTILVKTNSNLKDKNASTKIGTIYAGGDSGTSNIPTNISVINEGPASSISLSNIVGRGASGADVSGNMNVTLSNIAPTVYGGTGTNTLSIGSTYSRQVSMSRIDNLNVTYGTLELSDDSVVTINNVNIAQGAILDLRQRFDDLTINTYTGQGGIALGNEGAKVNVTQPISTNESLTVYLGNYTPSGTNGWHSKNYTYVTTANDDAPVALYGDNNFSSGYDFIPVSNEGKYEWKVAKSTTPDEVEPEEKDPVLTALETTEPSKTVSVDGFEEGAIPSVEYPFSMVTNPPLDDFTWLDQFNPEITVGGYTAEKHFDEEENFTTYRVDELDMTIYFELGDDGDFNSQKMVVLFQDESGNPSTLQPATYDFEISVKDVPALELTLDVQGKEEEEPQPTLPVILGLDPEGFDTTKTFSKSEFLPAGTRSTFFEFRVETRDGEQALLSDYEDLEVHVNYAPTQRIEHEGDSHLYFDSPENKIKTYFELDEETDVHKLVVTAYDGDGAPAVPMDVYYDIRVMYKDLPYMLFTANVVPDQLPPKEDEDEDEETKVSTLKSFSIDPEEATKTVEVNEDGVEVGEFASYTFNADIEGGNLDSLVGYEGLTLIFDDEELELITDTDGNPTYRIDGTSTNIYLDKDETTGTYKLRLVATKSDEGNVIIPSFDKHTIKVSHPDVEQPLEISLQLEIKEQTPPPTIDQEEEEPTVPTVTKITFPNNVITKIVDLREVGLGVEFPFNMTLEGKGSDTVGFQELGYSVTINGQEAKLVGTEYVLEGSQLRLGVNNNGSGQFLATLYTQDETGMVLPLPKGNYNVKAVGPKDFEFNIIVKDTTPPTTEGDKDKEEPTNPPSGGSTGGSSTGGNTGGGTTTEPTTPPTTDKDKEETKPSTPPTTDTDKEEDKKPTTSKPSSSNNNRVENIENIRKEMQEKVDSLLTEIKQQEEGTLTLSLKGDGEDLQNISTLEVTSDGVFINVDGERIKFNATLPNVENIDWDNTRINRLDGSPVPHKQNGDGFIITSSDLSDLVISPKVDVPFTDVNDGDWYKDYVEEAYNLGITTGTTATTFDANSPVTRAQAAAMLARTFEFKPVATGPTLSDVEGEWYADDVQTLTDAGIINGYPDGTFRGDAPITREQLAMLLTRTLETQGVLPVIPEVVKQPELNDKNIISREALNSVLYLASKDVINSGPGTNFTPKATATRSQIVKMVINTAVVSGQY